MQRQYTGTAGRIENAQVAVYLVYAGRARARDDRPGALPARSPGPSDPDRLDAAGVPDDIEFATKPALATGDAHPGPGRRGPGPVGGRRRGLRRRPRPARRAARPSRIGYVLAIGCDRRVPTDAGPIRADELAAGLPRRAWQRLSAGPGAKGQRFYDWAWIDHTDRAHRDDPLDTQCWSLLIRRNRDTGELAFYRCYSPDAGAAARPGPRRRPPLDHRGVLPGRQGPGRAGRAPGPPLDLLAPLDPAGDARPRPARRHSPPTSTTDRPAPADLIALTCNEIRRLFTALIVEPARALGLPAGLVTTGDAATNTAPAPATTSVKATPDDITIYGWSTSTATAVVCCGGGSCRTWLSMW